MQFVAYPFNIEWEFLLKGFDKSLADVTEWSNVVGKNPNFHVRPSGW